MSYPDDGPEDIPALAEALATIEGLERTLSELNGDLQEQAKQMEEQENLLALQRASFRMFMIMIKRRNDQIEKMLSAFEQLDRKVAGLNNSPVCFLTMRIGTIRQVITNYRAVFKSDQ